MKEQVQQYVKHCQCCQKSKAMNKAPAGELLPLPTPQGPWQDITVDFTKMPESLGYNNILVVVDLRKQYLYLVPKSKTPSQQPSCLEITSGASMAFLLRLFLIVDRSSHLILWVNYIKSWKLNEKCLWLSTRRLTDKLSD